MTVQDLEGISHTAEVTASSLFEAVAQGLAALRKNEWVEGIEERFGIVKVSVAEVRVEHQVKIADFTKWLAPREMTQRQKIRAILGMSVSSGDHPLNRSGGCVNLKLFQRARWCLLSGLDAIRIRDTTWLGS